MIPAETIPGMGVGEIKENSGGGVYSSMIYLYIVRTFVNTTIYLHLAQQYKKEKIILNVAC
jgi:hypothetical protein